MPKSIDHQNVNGVTLSLDIVAKSESPKSRLFTISFKNSKSKSSWPKLSLFLAVSCNIVSVCYIPISLTAILIIIIILSFLIFFWITHSVQSESILVIPSVGIQSSIKYVFGREDNFVPWNKIEDVIINEVIKLNRVLYFLTILVKPEPESESIKLIPLFKYTKPRLVMIQAMYAELQSLLTEERPQLGSGDTG